MSSNIQIKAFKDININDPFFDTLKADYKEFEEWFKKKAAQNTRAYVQEIGLGINAFLFLKVEDEEIIDIEPKLNKAKRLKVGTFKINAHGTKLGERFIKKIFDIAVYYDIKEIYVTIFPKHEALILLFKRYGFLEYGKKSTGNGNEIVLLKNMDKKFNEILLDYPKVYSTDKNKWLLAIYPKFHTRLFPDSILNNETFDIVKDISHTNSIEKVYICFMNLSSLKRGDIIVIYRTSDGLGPAYHRSVVTSVCIVEELKSKQDFNNIQSYLDYCKNYSVFDQQELTGWFNRQNFYVLKMTYNAAFSIRINRNHLINEIGLNAGAYWGFMKLTDTQFNEIILNGGINESIIIN